MKQAQAQAQEQEQKPQLGQGQVELTQQLLGLMSTISNRLDTLNNKVDKQDHFLQQLSFLVYATHTGRPERDWLKSINAASTDVPRLFSLLSATSSVEKSDAAIQTDAQGTSFQAEDGRGHSGKAGLSSC